MKIISFVLFSCIGNQAIDISIHEYALRDPLLFGDYRNMINENEPRFYEDLLDYEAIYFLFQEVLMTMLFIFIQSDMFVAFCSCHFQLFTPKTVTKYHSWKLALAKVVRKPFSILHFRSCKSIINVYAL